MTAEKQMQIIYLVGPMLIVILQCAFVMFHFSRGALPVQFIGLQSN